MFAELVSPVALRGLCIGVVAAVLSGAAFGQQAGMHQRIFADVDRHATRFSDVSKAIWDYAERGYQERKSSALLRRELQSAGFRVRSGVADEPTGFVAEYGQGQPVIAILGEFDALPGMSQAAVPDRRPLTTEGAGHGDGHNLLGAGAALAATAADLFADRQMVPDAKAEFQRRLGGGSCRSMIPRGQQPPLATSGSRQWCVSPLWLARRDCERLPAVAGCYAAKLLRG